MARIGSQARIGAQAGVMNDVPAATDVVGSPAWPARETLRAFARLRKHGVEVEADRAVIADIAELRALVSD